MKTLLGVVIELVLAVSMAGLILAVAVPLLNRNNLTGANDFSARSLITGLLVGAVAVALFRPGSAIRRHMKR